MRDVMLLRRANRWRSLPESSWEMFFHVSFDVMKVPMPVPLRCN
jgi:hypothetical protein